MDERDPLSIFSNPTANTHSALPDSIICLAKSRADEPVEQLLFTLNIGMPVIPMPYKARWPHVESPTTEKYDF